MVLLLDLPYEILVSVIDKLYKPPSNEVSDGFLGQTRPRNRDLFVLSLVCKAFHNYTYPLRFKFVECKSPSSLAFFIRMLESGERFQNAVHHLSLRYL